MSIESLRRFSSPHLSSGAQASLLRSTFAIVLLALPFFGTARAQRPDSAAASAAPDTASKPKWPDKFQINWNEYNLGVSTIVIGAAWLTDYATYNQDSLSEAQFQPKRQGKIRDSRFMVSGVLNTTRSATWQTGIMYDWPVSKWRIRQTTITVAVPEISGWINVGRTKEGISLNRVMVGYDGWTSERFTFSDAAIPLLADGVKWLGYAPRARLLWNLGVYTNWLSERESFSYYEKQVVARLARVTMKSDTGGTLLHIGAAVHVGKPQHDTLQLKSKPEVFEAPNFIDTGKFPATLGTIAGIESYYRTGPWLFGTEYYFEWVDSKQAKDPFFHGGDIFASWVITGESRPYTTAGGFFRTISPARPTFKGGRGAWEAVLRFSTSNLDSRDLKGGQFWRITPMVNWYMNDHARFEFSYGYGSLERFGKRGTTEFFQVRLQLQFAKLGAGSD